jgi:hypothetical protein
MNHNRSVTLLTFVLVSFLAATLSALWAARASDRGNQRSVERDRQALILLENEWLGTEHNAATLERILAADFVHPVLTGNFLNKTQHIYYSTKYLPPANLKNRFEQMNVRLYGDVGVVNGIVVTSDEHGKDVDKSIFTDVFVYRDGRWQAINAQENRVEKMSKPQ